jgi:hypothetical protein
MKVYKADDVFIGIAIAQQKIKSLNSEYSSGSLSLQYP